MAKSRKVSKQRLLTGFAVRKLTTFDRSGNHILQPLQTVTVFTKFAASSTLFYPRYSVSKAEKRLRAHAQWRKEYVPLGRIEEVSQNACSTISQKMHSRIPLTFALYRVRFCQSSKQTKPFCKVVTSQGGH